MLNPSHSRSMRRIVLYPALLLVAYAARAAEPNDSQGTESLDEITITGARQSTRLLDSTLSVSRIDAQQIQDLAAQHYSAVLNEAAGVFAQRNSGQEGLIAIRSPVLTGAGACGAFLFLEDGFPLRPPGFCNVNELFELNTEQAQAVEVVRGPDSALYGANALHGAVQVLGPDPAQLPQFDGALESGSDQFVRAKLASRLSEDWGAYLVATHDGGFRFHSDTDEAKANLRYLGTLGAGTLRFNFAGSALDQNTASFIQGLDAYRSSSLRDSNPNPEAYRRAQSARANIEWSLPMGNAQTFDARAIVRWSNMNFLQHFLLGEPQERNGQRSIGTQFGWSLDASAVRINTGIDADFSQTRLIEFQSSPTTGGAPAAVAIRPEGFHYDYDVDTVSAGVFARIEWDVSSRWLASAAVRADRIHYDYDNHTLTGNTDDQGVPCGSGGCLYSRPADRRDAFDAFSPQVSLLYRLGEQSSLYATASRGFRPPESSELYRLQRQQSIADLHDERLDMAEVGARAAARWGSISLAGYLGRKTHFIFRDANGFDVSDGVTRHRGVELEGLLFPHAGWELRGSASIARHTYDFSRSADQGERIAVGNEVDTAPRRLYWASLTRRWSAVTLGGEWRHVGQYYLDAANTALYSGHNVFDARATWRITANWSGTVRIDNVFDRAYADRADFAFGNYRYLPGRPRTAYAEVRYRVE